MGISVSTSATIFREFYERSMSGTHLRDWVGESKLLAALSRSYWPLEPCVKWVVCSEKWGWRTNIISVSLRLRRIPIKGPSGWKIARRASGTAGSAIVHNWKISRNGCVGVEYIYVRQATSKREGNKYRSEGGNILLWKSTDIFTMPHKAGERNHSLLIGDFCFRSMCKKSLSTEDHHERNQWLT